MASRFICDNQLYIAGGENYNVLALPLSLSTLPPTIHMEGTELVVKGSFHVSLVCIGEIMKKNSIQSLEFIDQITKEFCEFSLKSPIEFIGLRNEFRFVSLGDQKSVVVMCDVKNLDKFFTLINEKYKLALEYPPTHITLYTQDGNKGIFLTDSGDLNTLTKLVPSPIDFEDLNIKK